MSKELKHTFGNQSPIVTDEEIQKIQKIKKISITKNLTKLPAGAFYNRKELTSVYFEKDAKLSVIPESCFNNCSSLSKINLPSNLITIQKEAFKNCLSIIELILPNTILEVHGSSFDGWGEHQTIISPKKLSLSMLCKANIIYENDSNLGTKSFRVKERSLEQKKYLVTAKCGHVGRHKYIPIIFPVSATNKKEAAKIAREIPRVKHDHKDAILAITPVDDVSYNNQIEINKKDPYLAIKRKADQKKIMHLIKDRLVDEPNYTRKD
jgi:hypothetical protein